MPFIFNFPDIGEGLTEGKLLEWYIEVGQVVKEGDLLAKVETDKVIADIPTPRGGQVLRLHGAIDEIIYVGNPLVEIAIEGESLEAPAGSPLAVASQASASQALPVAAPAASVPQATPVAAPEVSAPQAAPVAAPAISAPQAASEADSGPGVVGNIEVATGREVMPGTGEGFPGYVAIQPGSAESRPLASPLARALAKAEDVSLESLSGTGVGGRITKSDVLKAVNAGSSSVSVPREEATTEALSTLRKTIARRMSEAKFSAPHATTFEEVDVSSLAAWRRENKEALKKEGRSLSYLPFVCKAICSALLKHPKMNCRLDMEASTVTWQPFVHLGIAVDTPQGLMVPVIHDAHLLSVSQLSERIADLAERARTRKITLDELRGGTFSITNYGSIAGIHAAPIINTPEAAILGVGRILEKPVVKQGNIVPATILPLSLAVDHRIVDGGDAARFLRDLMASLADPMRMLLD